MKKVLASSLVVLMALFLSAGFGLAGNGQGGGNGAGNGGGGNGSGTGPIHDILSGTPFTVTGDVVSIVPGGGIVIATTDGNVTIYGIGPVRYWDSEDVVRPAVSDTITVTGYTVDYNGELRNIAVTITVGDDTVQLRDPETGAPLWRGSGGNSN